MRTLFVANFAALGLNLLLLDRSARRVIDDPEARRWTIASVALLMLSWCQAPEFRFPFVGSCWFFNVLLVLAALTLIADGRRIASIACATVAGFALSSGFLALPLVAAVGWLTKRWPWWLASAIVVVSGALVWLVVPRNLIVLPPVSQVIQYAAGFAGYFVFNAVSSWQAALSLSLSDAPDMTQSP